LNRGDGALKGKKIFFPFNATSTFEKRKKLQSTKSGEQGGVKLWLFYF